MALSINQPQQNASAYVLGNNMISFFMEAKPQMSNIVFYNHHGLLPMNVFKSLSLIEKIEGELAQHFEAGWQHPNFHVQATVAPVGAGNNITFQVSTNDVVNGNCYTRVTDTYLFKDGTSGSVISKVFSGGFWNITVSPYDATYSLTVSAGDPVWIIGNTQIEGSNGVDPRDTGRQLLQFPLQIVREMFQATGSALTTELWFKTDQLGNMRDTYGSGYIDEEYRFIEQIGNLAVFGPQNTNVGNSDTNMYSLDYVTTSAGNTTQYFNGIYGINEFKENIRYADKKGSGSNMLTLVGPEFGLSFTTGASDVLAQNPNQLVTMSSSNYTPLFTEGLEADAKELQVDISFDMLKYRSFRSHFCVVGQWGYETTGGANGYSQTGNAYMIPLQRAKDAAGTLRDRFMMRYKSKDRWNRAMQVWETGGQASIPTSNYDGLQVNYLGHWGTEEFGAEHFQKCFA